MDKLEELVELQTKFMDALGVERLHTEYMQPEQFDNSAHSYDIQKHLAHLMFALVCELGEIGDEVNWKSWKKTRHPVNMGNLKMEFIDALHFLLEMMITCGMDAKSIHEEYVKKMIENIDRQKRGY